MHYLGFLCLGLGILFLVAGMIFGLLSFASHEKVVKINAKRFAMMILPFAFVSLMIGIALSFHMLVPSE